MNVTLEIQAIERTDGNHAIRIAEIKKSDLKLDAPSDLKQHLKLLSKATVFSMLLCEKEGVFKTGEAIKKVMRTIEEEYINASNELIYFDL